MLESGRWESAREIELGVLIYPVILLCSVVVVGVSFVCDSALVFFDSPLVLLGLLTSSSLYY